MFPKKHRQLFPKTWEVFKHKFHNLFIFLIAKEIP